jgi:hypothetical protein
LFVTGIDASGDVAGYYYNSGLAELGFIYDPTTQSYTTLSGPDGSGDTNVTVGAISDSGVVTGTYHSTNANIYLGYIYNPTTSSYTVLSGPSNSGDSIDSVAGINASGDVVGQLKDSSNDLLGFIYDPTTSSYTILSGPDSSGDRDISATGINASGDVVGSFINSSSQGLGFIYDPTTSSYTTLSGPDSSGDTSISLAGIDASGDVAGSFLNSSNQELGFIYDLTTSSYTTLYGPNAMLDPDASATGINASGDVVGVYFDSDFNQDSFVYDPTTGTYTTLSGADSSGDTGIYPNGINASGEVTGTYENSNNETVGFIADPACYCAGTMIRTPEGAARVETLAIGDSVTTADGQTMPVRWIGRNTVSTRFADPLRVLPIRIKAGALGDSIPARDLLVSADHAVLVEDILIQAGALVNGVSILREQNVPETFTYYHVELADHALILAEGAPAETFVDNISRMGFDNWAEHEALYGSDPLILEMPYPRAQSRRQVPMEISQSLWRRACAMTAAHTRAVAA